MIANRRNAPVISLSTTSNYSSYGGGTGIGGITPSIITTSGPKTSNTTTVITTTNVTKTIIGGTTTNETKTTTTTATRSGIRTGPTTTTSSGPRTSGAKTTTTTSKKSVVTKSSNAKTNVKKESGSGLAMIIDSKVNEADEGIFYFLPTEMNKLGLLNPEKFDSCEIRNVQVDDIRASALLGILSALKPRAKVTVLICQPIAVMQPYEAEMIEANAKLAGFINIKTSPSTFFNEFSNQEEETLSVSFTKPEKPVF